MLFGPASSVHKTGSLGVTVSDDNMGDSSMNTVTNLHECIQQAISQLNYDTAEFLSELLYAECSTMDSTNVHKIEAAYLYSLSLYLNQNFHTALQVSSTFRDSHIGIAYIFGLCAHELSTSLNDAIKSILLVRENYISSSTLIHFPNSATLSCLLGKLCGKLDRTKESASYFSEALNKNPYLWEAYTSLSKMRASVDLKKLYSIMLKRNHSTAYFSRNKFNSVTKPYTTPFKSHQPLSSNPTSSSSSSSVSSLNVNDLQNQNISTNRSTNKKGVPSASILNKTNVTVTTASLSMSSTKQQPTISSMAKASNRNRVLTTPPSKRLAPEKTSTFKTPRNNINGYTSNNIMNTDIISKDVSLRRKMELTSHQNLKSQSISLSELIYIFARVLKASSLYDSYKAIRLANSLIPTHIRDNMPWCQAQLGKLHFELVNYDVSLKYFTNLRQLQPTRVKDLEIYSTLLWHLHDKVKLSVLANELATNISKMPQTWCCMGNFLSLQKDHEEAIKAFEKATQVDPNFAYAYTLQGHEHSSNDTFDTAKNCYRKALACDSQHYNAYYGLGMSCMKLGQYEEALLHFEKARSINPINVILICCCGVALEKLQYQEKALQYYELACELQPSSSLATFKRAHLLYSMGRYSIALQHFEELTKMAPDEATVHFLLGQLYQILGRRKDAVKEFTVAMNLDPKGSQLIIEALEKCHTQD